MNNSGLVYVCVSTFTNGITSVFNFIYARKKISISITRYPRIKHHLPNMLTLFACSLATVIYINADITMLGIYRNDYEVGIYSVSTRIYSIVKQIINAAMVVCLPRVSYYLGNTDKKRYSILLNHMFHFLVLFVIPAMAGLICLSKDVVLLIAGEDYYEAHTSLKLLSISLVFAVLAGFETTQILLPHKEDKALLNITIISAFINVILNIFLLPRWGSSAAAITTIMSEFAVVLLSYDKAKKYFRPKVDYFLLALCLAECLFIIGICALCNIYINSIIFRIIISIVMSCLVYLIMLLGYWKIKLCDSKNKRL